MMIGPEWIVRSAVSIVLLGCMSVASKLSAQSTLGVTGLLNSPSAEMAADGTVRIGANFLNDRLTPATFDYHTFNYYLNVTFLPFLEVALASTAFMNERRTAFVNEDRSVSVRVRLLGERRVRPAIAVGSNDLFTSSDGGRFSTSGGEGNQYFGSTYVALSKHFVFSGHRFGVHLAYNVSMNDRFRIDSPVSGGVSFSPRFCRRMNLIAEYDTRCFNLGAKLCSKACFLSGVAFRNSAIRPCGRVSSSGCGGPEKRIGTAGVVA